MLFLPFTNQCKCNSLHVLSMYSMDLIPVMQKKIFQFHAELLWKKSSLGLCRREDICCLIDLTIYYTLVLFIYQSLPCLQTGKTFRQMWQVPEIVLVDCYEWHISLSIDLRQAFRLLQQTESIRVSCRINENFLFVMIQRVGLQSIAGLTGGTVASVIRWRD